MIIRIDVGVDAGVVMLVMTMMMHVLYFFRTYISNDVSGDDDYYYRFLR